MQVIVTGTLAYDYIMDFPGRFADRIMADKIHKLSLSFLVNKLSKQFGGTAGNIAYTLKLLGVEPMIISAAGNDFEAYNAFLGKHGIDTSLVAIHKNEPTGSYHVVTDKDDNQIGAFYVGATKYAKRLTVKLASQGVPLRSKKMFVIIAPTDPQAMKKYVAECAQAGIPYLYDPAFQVGTFSESELKEGIEGAELLIGNDYEISLMEERLGVSHEELLVMGPQAVITTLGAKGSIIETTKEAIHVPPARPSRVIDPTGAGDAYRAGFVAGYLRGYDLVTCGQMGSVAAVYTVERYGTVTHEFTKHEYQTRYKENYKTNILL